LPDLAEDVQAQIAALRRPGEARGESLAGAAKRARRYVRRHEAQAAAPAQGPAARLAKAVAGRAGPLNSKSKVRHDDIAAFAGSRMVRGGIAGCSSPSHQSRHATAPIAA